MAPSPSCASTTPSAMNALSPAVKAGMEANVPKLVGDAAVRAIRAHGYRQGLLRRR